MVRQGLLETTEDGTTPFHGEVFSREPPIEEMLDLREQLRSLARETRYLGATQDVRLQAWKAIIQTPTGLESLARARGVVPRNFVRSLRRSLESARTRLLRTMMFKKDETSALDEAYALLLTTTTLDPQTPT